MPTDIEIASNALLLIGDNPISSFTEAGAGPQVAKNIYEETYKSVLAEHPWTFALKEQELSLLSQTPDAETFYSKAYQMPVDLIRLWAIMPNSNYTIVGQYIYSNQSSLLARYVFEVDETLLPAHFVKALEYRLASEFAISITESASMAEGFMRKYFNAVAMARSIDSQGHPQVPIIHSPFTDVRLSGAYSRFY